MRLVRLAMLVLFALVISRPAHAFEFVIGGPDTDTAYAVEQAPDGGIVAAGFYQNVNFLEFYVVKTDATGELEWETRIQDLGWKDIAYDLICNDDGSIIVIGSAILPELGAKPILLKLNAVGELLWNTEDGLTEQIPTSSGIVQGYARSDGTIVIGGGNNTMTDIVDPWLATVSPDGELLDYYEYDQLFGGGWYNQTHVFDIAETADGGTALTGYVGGQARGYLWKIGPDFETDWVLDLATETFAGMVHSVDLAANGDLIVAGAQGNNRKTQIVRVDNDGNIVWFSDLQHPDVPYSAGEDIVERADGSLALVETAFTAFGSPVNRSAVLHVDGIDGSLIGRFEVAVADSSTAMRAGAPTSDGGYVLAGSTNEETNFDTDLAIVFFGPETFIRDSASAPDLVATPSISLSPNPVRNRLQLVSPYPMRSMTVFDANGREQASVAAEGNRMEFDTSGLNEGVHFIRIETTEGSLESKIVIRR